MTFKSLKRKCYDEKKKKSKLKLTFSDLLQFWHAKGKIKGVGTKPRLKCFVAILNCQLSHPTDFIWARMGLWRSHSKLKAKVSTDSHRPQKKVNFSLCREHQLLCCSLCDELASGDKDSHFQGLVGRRRERETEGGRVEGVSIPADICKAGT